MLVLGVTGGVGAGKSTVLDHMEEAWGAQILKADEAAHADAAAVAARATQAKEAELEI